MFYFIPNAADSFTPRTIAAAGLSYAFEPGVGVARCAVRGAGPSGGSGLIISQTAEGLGYFPERQEWRKIPGLDAWAGRPKEGVAPETLARAKQLAGEWVELADGQRWLVPVARSWITEDGELRYFARLPQTSTLDDEGNWRSGGVAAKYASLWKTACDFWDAWIGAREDGDGRLAFDFGGLHDGALLALSTNYRIGKAEAALLGIFDDRCVVEVLKALVDWDSFATELKKKAAVADSSGSGGVGV